MRTNEFFRNTSDLVSHPLPTAARRSRRHGMPFKMIGLLLFGLLGATHTMTASDEGNNAYPAVGTWRVNVAFNGVSCAPGQIIPFSCIQGLIIVHSDHTMAEVDNDVPPSQQSWGAGVWQPDGPNSIAWTFEQLQFDSLGNPIYYDFVWGSLTVSNDGQTSSWTGGFASYNFDGTLITAPGSSGTFAATGSRMHVMQSSAIK